MRPPNTYPNLPKRWGLVALFGLLPCLAPGAAFAATHAYSIPMDNTVAKMTVPDSWNPNSSDTGLDAASPDGKVFFSVYAATDEDEKGALRGAASIMSDGAGLTINIASVQENSVVIGKASGREYTYTATQDGKPQVLVIDLIKLKGGGYLQIMLYGSRDGLGKNAKPVAKIFGTLQLLGR